MCCYHLARRGVSNLIKRYTDMAATLGASWIKQFIRIKIPLLLTLIMTAFAIGFSVSCALYLPTIFASNGRMTTLTTEAVTFATSVREKDRHLWRRLCFTDDVTIIDISDL